jgi:putative heme iron utilization protein
MTTTDQSALVPRAAPEVTRGGSGDGSAAEGGASDGSRTAAAALARDLVRCAFKGTLCTVSRSGGTPYGSLVAVATTPGGAPLLLLSGLAEHTANIMVDRRASVLIDGTGAGPAALTGARLTLVGRIVDAGGEVARQRYLSRHPDAAAFIDFADFGLYALEVDWAHLVAGFGRIVRLGAADVVIDTVGAEPLIEAEQDVLRHMNDDHADAIRSMAEQASSSSSGRPGANHADPTRGEPWRMTGCDPEGIDLVAGANAVRVRFPRRADSPDAVREALVALVRQARATPSGSGEKNGG